MTQHPSIVSLFSGCGGLDLGFEQAGFRIAWANEYDRVIVPTYRRNFPHTPLDTRSIATIPTDDIPPAVGIIGGPPCQSWSEAGAKRGINDPRGQLFLEYIRVLREKQPRFFLAENVSGMLAPRNQPALQRILAAFGDIGYHVSYRLLNARHYGVPQDRERVIIVGYHHTTGKAFTFPPPDAATLTLRDALTDLQATACPARAKNHANPPSLLAVPNHEYAIGGFSSIYMSRNRVRGWHEASFTIQAGARHIPIHPQAPRMEHVGKDQFRFVPGCEHRYRRLTVRECARIQTFPDTFVFAYQRVGDGYKMVGNAVPVAFARRIAQAIMRDLFDTNPAAQQHTLLQPSLL